MNHEYDYVDVEFNMKNGTNIILENISIKAFDALKRVEPDNFERHFIWGDDAGVAIDQISSWTLLEKHL